MKESRRITPLRTILRNCLNHIENLETNRSICDNYDKEFQDLKQFSETLKVQKDFSCTEGEKEVNKKKNRYKDILPFNVSRVVLNEYAGIPGSDYINANFIRGASGSPAYIASQGPLPNTVNDFWRMVVECEVQVIVMACNSQESGKHKCENYWVEKEGEEKKFGMVQICLVKASTVCPDFLVRTMRLKYTNDKDVTEERTVCQFHYSAWPDHGVPPLVRPLLDMVRLVRDTQASETLPVLVHCSAGCGRTGTICAIDFVWGLLRAGKLTEEFSLFNLVRDMRKQRVAMVQTKEQYILVHQAVRELFKEQLQVIESHPYENIDFNGVPLIKDFEEPFYDTIRIQKEENCDEKQDKSEVKEKGEDADGKVNKMDAAPPLPRKKRPNVLFSKQEKEAENLTEKNRSSFAEKEKDKTDASLSSLLGKPRIVKLRALFEKSPTTKERSALKDRGSQTVSRSHSLGAIRKPLVAEVFDSQTEKSKPSSAPHQSKNAKSFSKPSVPLIKRSKSLKTFSQASQLTVSPSISVDRKSAEIYPAISRGSEVNGTTNSSEIHRRKIAGVDKTWETSRECSVRRRSLESLLGDILPPITWPNVVMAVEKDVVRGRQKSDRSAKMTSQAFRGDKTADSIRQQLQRLSVETEKKVNHFVSGIGTRERRNSFRQAVSRNDFQTAFKNFRENASSSKKSSGNDCFRGPRAEMVRNPNDNSIYFDKTMLLEREGTLDVKSSATKTKPIVFDGGKYKLTESVSGSRESSGKKAGGRHPMQENSSAATSFQNAKPSNHHTVLDPRMRKVISSLKSNKSGEELERNAESKNLFLKKLNSEILYERENLLKQGETRYRLICDESEKPTVSHFPPGPGTTPNDPKRMSTKAKTTGYGMNSESTDEPDGSKGARPGRPIEFESNEKIFQQHWANANLQGHQKFVKIAQKPANPADDFKNYSAANQGLYNPHRKRMPHQNAGGESSINLRREEAPPSLEVRHKEQFFPFPQKMNVCCVAPTKAMQKTELSSQGSHRRDPAGIPDPYATSNPDYENPDRKMASSSRLTTSEKGNKNFDCLPWSPSASSRSSGEASSSDQHSTKSDSSRLLDNSISKTDVKMIKKIDQAKRAGKIRSNESSKMALANGSSKQKRPDEMANCAADVGNYGVMAAAKVRSNSTKYSKDDFLVEVEPTAPPRVKRHASVTIPRSNLSNPDNGSTWIGGDDKSGTDIRNSTREADKNAWSGSFGVDLDAVAASMQHQGKGELSVMKNSVWPGKNHLSTSSSSSSTKKKQHYF